MELARFRCAIEVGFLPKPQEVFIAKNDFRPGFGARVEQGDEFYLVDDAPIGQWMDPVDDLARQRAQAAVDAKKRKAVGAAHAAPTTPLAVPRSGMAGTFSHTPIPQHAIRDVQTDARVPQQAAPPRRRAAKTA